MLNYIFHPNSYEICEFNHYHLSINKHKNLDKIY